MKVSSGLEYRVLDGNSAVLCGVGECLDEHIIVPSAIRGYSIVGIAERAFYRSSQIKSITLSRSIRFIEPQAFAWCRELTEINLFNTEEIGERAFMGCDMLTRVNFGKQLGTIGEKAFAYCPSLTSMSLPNSLTRLGSASFEGCRNLCSISLSDGIRIIENGTFYACEKLRRVELPSKLEYIDEHAFAYCVSIVEMNLPPRTVINDDAFFECGRICGNGRVS